MTTTHTYQVINGTSYDSRTSQQVIDALEYARMNDLRIRVYFGDVETGKCWNEEHDIFGYIGRSNGQNQVPLLIANSRSHGGGHLLDHCIIKIKESKGSRVLYQASNFKQPVIDMDYAQDHGDTPYRLIVDGEVYSFHPTERSAQLLKNKLS